MMNGIMLFNFFAEHISNGLNRFAENKLEIRKN